MSSASTTGEQNQENGYVIVNRARNCWQTFERGTRLLPGKILGPKRSNIASLDYTSDFEQFRVWTKNLGVFASDTASVDYRLRDAHEVRKSICSLLDALSTNVARCITIVETEQRNFQQDDEVTTPDFSVSSSSSDEEDEESNPALQLHFLLQDVSDLVEKLIKISVAIRKSGLRARNLRADAWEDKNEDDIEGSGLFEQSLRLILEKRYGLFGELQSRICAAICRQRHRIKYWRSHQENLSFGSHFRPMHQDQQQDAALPILLKTSENLANIIQGAKTEKSQNTNLSQHTEATRYTKIDLDQSGLAVNLPTSIISSHSYASKATIPKPPSVKSGLKYFQCPYCCILCPREKADLSSKWRSHVISDLCPFVCVDASCKATMVQFEKESEWFEHHKKHHAQEWWCDGSNPPHEPEVFHDSELFVKHIQTAHKTEYSETQLRTLVQMSETSAEDPFRACPFCDVKPSTIQSQTHHYQSNDFRWRSHIANHLVDLFATYALPDRDDVESQVSNKTIASFRRSTLDHFYDYHHEIDFDLAGLGIQEAAHDRDYEIGFDLVKELPMAESKDGSIEHRVDFEYQWNFMPVPQFDGPEHVIDAFSKGKSQINNDQVPKPIESDKTENEDAIAKDIIRGRIQNTITEEPELKEWSQSMKDETVKFMIMKSQPPPFWEVSLRLPSIRQCTTLPELMEALSNLPMTTYDIYSDTLQDLTTTDQFGDAITVFRWLCFSFGILEPLEFVEILAIENGEEGGFSPEKRLMATTDLISLCPKLIYCNLADFINDNGSPMIELVHFTLKEYLLSEECVLRSQFQPETCHREMAESCLRYLLNLAEKGPLTEELCSQYPLAGYAAAYWWQHALNVNKRLGKTVVDLAFRLLNTQKTTLLMWVQLYGIERPTVGPNFSLTLEDIAEPVYYAAEIGLHEVMKEILEAGCDVSVQGGAYGNALQAAAYFGHIEPLHLLVDAGVDVNARGGLYGNALQAAARSGHFKTTHLLLKAGADVNAQGGYHGNALQAAAYSGHVDIINLLVGFRANVNAQGGYHGNALQAAGSSGSLASVGLLEDYGADVNAQGGYYGNALQAAAFFDHVKSVRWLLKAGADVNIQGGFFGNALRAAVSADHVETIRVLLNAGADVNAQKEGEYGTALQVASGRGNLEVVRMLLEAGAKVENLNGTALIEASNRGHLEVVRMLIEKAIDVDEQDKSGNTALIFASTEGHHEIVKMLLQAGANQDIVNVDWETSLIMASSHGYLEVVQLLLENEADHRYHDRDGNTALLHASAGGFKEVVEILIQYRANTLERNNDGQTALMLASKYGHPEVVRILLRHEADVHDEDRDGDTSLMLASRFGHSEVVQILQEAGARF